MKKRVVNWSVEPINPTKLGTDGGGNSNLEIPTDCSFFRLCFEGRHIGAELFDFSVDYITHLSMNVSEGTDGILANRVYIFEPPFKGPDVWYDQKIRISSISNGPSLDWLAQGVVPTKDTAVSIYIERWYYDA